MKQHRWTWLATAALFVMQPAAELWAQTTTTPPATVCPNCPNGGVPKRDGTGMKKQQSHKGHKAGKGQHKGMQQQGGRRGGGGGGGRMHGGPRGGGRS